VVTLPRALLDELVAHARSELPNESCGLLGGRDGAVTSFHAARNADSSPYRYTVDAQDALRIVLEIEDGGDELVAIYHSHTRSAPYPSRTDMELATWPEAAYLILSLASEPPLLRAWDLSGEDPRELELTYA
jgi:proteasome lid subunit RPN8/RPN11